MGWSPGLVQKTGCYTGYNIIGENSSGRPNRVYKINVT